MKNKDELFSEMNKLSMLMRGMIIEGAIDIERCIDRYIANYYCFKTDKAADLTGILSQYVNAETKRIIFIDIIKRLYSKSEIKEMQPRLNVIEEIMSERNVIAHMELDHSDVAVEYFNKHNKIRYMRFKNGGSMHEIDYKSVENYNNKISATIDLLRDIKNSSIQKWRESDNIE